MIKLLFHFLLHFHCKEKNFLKSNVSLFSQDFCRKKIREKKIADYLHISETSTLKLLEALGGECAGVISISSEDEDLLSKETSYKLDSNNYEPLDDNRLLEFIEKMNTRPLIKADDKLRLSLAGAQEKLALAKINGEWYLPLNGSPSTHILKPTRTSSLSSLAQNEYICMKLAKSFGLPVPDVDLLNIAEKDIFVVERYDRIKEADSIQRLHQEDFCQALGIMSTSKYQNDGGPRIADIFNTILKVCTVPALESQKLLRYVLFNYIIGNCDSHGKNYSLIYKNNRVELSPLYDVVSTIIYSSLTEKLSMKIGKHYEIQKVTQEDFSLLTESLNIKYSVLANIFKDFAKKYINAFEELKNDEKISRDVLNSILQVVKSRF